MFHIDSVFIQERHDIGHGAKRRQPDRPQQHLPEAWRHLLGAAVSRGNRPRQFERHARATEFAKWIAESWQSGMHEHGGFGERLSKRMVIGDNQFETELFCGEGLGDARNAAINRNDQLGSLVGERCERVTVEAVALIESVGHIPRGRCVDRLKACD